MLTADQIARNIEKKQKALKKSRKHFTAMVRWAESLSEKNPELYKLLAILLAILGFGYIFIFIALSGGLLIWGVQAALTGHSKANMWRAMIVAAVLLFCLVKSLMVKSPPPEGTPVTAQEAPQLFAALDDLKKDTGIRIDKVVMNTAYNAAIVQVPKIIWLGMFENYLIVGYPYLCGVSVDQARACIAHELGHLDGSHGKAGAWIAQLMMAWNQLLQTFHRDNALMYYVFNAFYWWYGPLFEAYTLALRRLHEFEADELANELTTRADNALDLIGMSIKSRYMAEIVTPAIYLTAMSAPEPPEDFYEQLGERLRTLPESDIDDARLERFYLEALAHETAVDDSHPSLEARLKAIGYPADPRTLNGHALRKLLTIEPSAARLWLGSFGDALARTYSAEWKNGVTQSWRYYNQKAVDTLARLDELRKKESLTREEELEKVQIESRYYDGEERLAALIDGSNRFPEEAQMRFDLGVLLLERGKIDEGLAHLEAAAEPESNYRIKSWQQLNYFGKIYRGAEYGARYEEKLARYTAESQLSLAERAALSANERVVEHQLEAGHLKELREALACCDAVKTAYLVRRDLNYLKNVPAFLMLMEKTGLLSEAGELEQAVAYHLSQFEFDVQIKVCDSLTKKIRKTADSMPSALIYQRVWYEELEKQIYAMLDRLDTSIFSELWTQGRKYPVQLGGMLVKDKLGFYFSSLDAHAEMRILEEGVEGVKASFHADLTSDMRDPLGYIKAEVAEELLTRWCREYLSGKSSAPKESTVAADAVPQST